MSKQKNGSSNSSSERNYRKELEKKLANTHNSLVSFGSSILDYKGQDSARKLEAHVNDLVGDFNKLDELASSLQFSIPIALLAEIDQNANPDLYNCQFMTRTSCENQFTNSKWDFSDVLAQEFAKTFPGEEFIF